MILETPPSGCAGLLRGALAATARPPAPRRAGEPAVAWPAAASWSAGCGVRVSSSCHRQDRAGRVGCDVAHQMSLLEFQDPVRKAEYARLAEAEFAANLPASKKKYTCGGGHNGCAIDPSGRMTICVLSHRDGYDLRSGTFEQGWNGRLKEIRSTEVSRETICTHCRIRSLCSMCPANGELEGGDAESPIDFLCQVAHLRAFALGLEVPAHGDCDCCMGGRSHAALRESAERINKNSPAPENVIPFAVSNGLLPVLNGAGACSTGSCDSCSTHFR